MPISCIKQKKSLHHIHVTLYSMKEQGITQPVSLVSWCLSSLATACTARLYSARLLQLPHTGSPALGNLECIDRAWMMFR